MSVHAEALPSPFPEGPHFSALAGLCLLLLLTLLGHTLTATFDGLDRPKTETGPAAGGSSAQQVTTYSYDAAGRVTTATNAANETTVTTRDVMGRTVSVEVSGSGGTARVTSYDYSPDHNRVTVTEGAGSGAIATQTWTDTFGQTVLVRHADGSFRSSLFDVAGRVVSSTDELGRKTSYLHDGLGRKKRETLPDNAETNFTYNAAGNLTGRLMPGGLNWTATYDTAGRITGETLTGGGQTTRQFTYTYHPSGPQKGLLHTVADPRGITRTTTYDAFRRPQTVASTGSQPWHNLTVTTSYDNRGNPLTITRSGGDQPGTEISRLVDGYGQIASESVLLGGQSHSAITHTWDEAGRRSALSSGTGFDVAFGHDAAGQLTSTSEGSQTASFAYGTNGLLGSRTSPFRNQSVSSRDSRGRVLGQTTSANAAAVLSEGMTWRADSSMGTYTATRSGLHAWNESKAFAYNNRGQLLSETFAPWDGSSRTLNYQFDSGTPGVGVRTKAEVGSGGNTNWFVNASTVNPLARVTGENANNLLRTVPATGFAFGAARVEADINGVLFGDATHPGWADGTGAWSINLPLPAGENRLTVRAIHPSGWASAPASNSFTVTGQPQTITTAFDQVGNVSSRTWSGGKTQTLTWDAENRMIKVVQSGGGETAFTWTAVYDALGRRLQTTYTPSGGSAFTTASIYDPLVTHLEIGVVVNGTAHWKVHGPDVNGTYGGLHGTGGLEWITSGGQAVGIISDSFGNAVASVDANGVTWQTAKVGAYGPLPTSRMLTLESGASLAQAIAWRGNRLDPTGFIQLGVRPYDPAGGRFLSADPMGHGASMSLYCFANGDPVNFHDPDGYLAVGAWNLTTRVLGNTYVSGSLRTVGGVAQAGAGFAFAAGTSWTGVGAVGGVAVGLHGIDQAVAGIRTIATGQHQSSFTSMGIQRTGVSRNTADLIDGGISIAGSGGIGLASRVGTTAPVVVRAPTGLNSPARAIDQTYSLGLQSSRAIVLQANRTLYDDFVASGGQLIRQRDVARFASDGVTPVLGQYNSVQNSITLFKGSNLSTVSEELIHFRQIQNAGYLNKPFPRSMVDGLESDAATVLQQWGFKPQ
ncbi:MAG: RHS repeat-associated core domain-containing protein [Terrimicrobiaceae bacterium]|nr:RHS repeat-associated core domain-containing protein [Terrimicrobiaceae bacterium]